MKVRMQPVKVAQIEEGQALIDGSLEPGQKVVVDGQYKLQPGSTVKPAQPEGAPADRPEHGGGSHKQGKQGKPAAAENKQEKS